MQVVEVIACRYALPGPTVKSVPSRHCGDGSEVITILSNRIPRRVRRCSGGVAAAAAVAKWPPLDGCMWLVSHGFLARSQAFETLDGVLLGRLESATTAAAVLIAVRLSSLLFMTQQMKP